MMTRSRLMSASLMVLALFLIPSVDTITRARSSNAVKSGIVLTDRGLVRGIRAGQTMAYLGIPFAAAPVGDLRWRPPAHPAGWEGELPATAFSAVCPQATDDGDIIGDEDCLYLNVWTPARAPDSRLPVMVFIHGGGNVRGSSSVQAAGVRLYDGQLLAERGEVVVVTLQYRLGALGFLAHPGLSEESPWGVSGNYGLLDQIAALKWVQRNIGEFGGDPARVMIFGESAGAVDTCMLLSSPLAARLFSRALMQSGGCTARSLQERMSEGQAFAAAAGCPDAADPVACLRGLDVAALVGAVDTTPVAPTGTIRRTFGPNVDGYVLPESPMDALSSGRYDGVPFIVGANADETSIFGIPVISRTRYRQIVREILGPALGEMALAHYPVSEFGTARRALIAMTTDAQFVCPARRIARAVAASSREPVFRYFFSQRLGQPPLSAFGAFHGLEVFFVFQRLESIQGYDATDEDLALQAAILGYWTRFAAAGDPNGSESVSWPLYEAEADPFLGLGTPVAAGDGVRTDKCDFWDSISLGASPRAGRPLASGG